MLEPSVLPAIERALKDLRFGSVHLIVHEGQLVRVERVERIRLTETSGSLNEPRGRPTSLQEGRRDERVASCTDE